MSEQELVEVKPGEIDLFEAFIDPIAELEEKNPRVKFDITTYEGETECKKYIAKVGKFRIGIEKLRKSLKQEFLDSGRAVDKKAKLYQERIAAIDAVHSVPLKELENKRIAEALEIQEAAKAKERAIQDAKDAELDNFRRIAAETEAAAEAIEDTKRALREAAERKEELEAAALLAAENATLQAAQDAIDAEAKAKQDVLDAIAETQRQAKVKADRLAKEIADKYEVEQAEQRKIDAGILARQKDVEHRRDYNSKALEAIHAIVGGNKEVSESIVKEIINGNVPNVTMNY